MEVEEDETKNARALWMKPSAFMRRTLSLLFALAICSVGAEAPKQLFGENFDAAAVGRIPEGFKVLAGGFVVQQDGSAKFLELPGAPLDTFGVLFGPAEKAPISAAAKIFGTKTGRKFPAFGLSLGGAGGYRLQVSAAKKMLEIFKGDEVRASVPFDWNSGVWTQLRIQVRPAGAGCIVEGKAWPADGAEPKEWLIKHESPEAPTAGQAGVWGNPFSGTPIRFDDLSVTAGSI
jgi:hypothetical protein